MIKVVDASLDNIEDVARLESELFDTDVYSKESLQKELTCDLRLYKLAIKDDKVVGYIGCTIADDVADIMKVGVTKQEQRKGIGTHLVKTMVNELRARNISKIMLEVKDDNNKAQALYKKMGFVKLNKRPNYYGDGKDAIVYSLTITKNMG